MSTERFKAVGFIEVYRARGGHVEKVYERRQTIDSTLYTSLRDKLNNRDSAAGRGVSIDGIAYGSWNHNSGTFIDGGYAGTFAAGTSGGLVRTTPTSQQIKVSGTMSFGSTVYINMFEMGQGFTPAGGGVTQLITTRYAYDDALRAATTYVAYASGDALIVDWTLQIGA